MKRLIIYLGAPNDNKGNLSKIALSRANKVIEIYNFYNNPKILITGGFGDHFNTTNKPHGEYVKQYLEQKNIKKRDLLNIVKTNNTIQDAVLSKPIIEKYRFNELIITTSDFHIPRASFIFTNYFPNNNLIFYSAKTDFLLKEKLEKLKNHERNSLKKLIKDIKFCI